MKFYSIFILAFASINLTVICDSYADVPAFNSFSKQEVSANYFKYYCPADTIQSKWKNGEIYNGQMGNLTTEYMQAVEDRVNFYRRFVGLSGDIKADFNLNNNAQAASLMISASGTTDAAHLHDVVNTDILDPYKHYKFYTDNARSTLFNGLAGVGEGVESVLYYGISGDPIVRTSGQGLWSFPYKRLLLFSPFLEKIGIGSINPEFEVTSEKGLPSRLKDKRFSSGVITFQDGATAKQTPEFIAFPPAGYVPYVLIPAGQWSITVPGADLRSASASISAIASNGTKNLKTILVDLRQTPIVNHKPGTEFIDTLSWMIEGLNFFPIAFPTEEITFDVTINNVLINGQYKSINYKVYQYDPHNPDPKSYILDLEYGPKLEGSDFSFLKVKYLSQEGCLVHTPRGRNYFRKPSVNQEIIGLHNWQYSDNPQGEFKSYGDLGSLGDEKQFDVRTKKGFYKLVNIFEYYNEKREKVRLPINESRVIEFWPDQGFREFPNGKFLPAVKVSEITLKPDTTSTSTPTPVVGATPTVISIVPNPDVKQCVKAVKKKCKKKCKNKKNKKACIKKCKNKNKC